MGVGGVVVDHGRRRRVHGVDLVRVDGERGRGDGTYQGEFTLEINERNARENTPRRCVIDREIGLIDLRRIGFAPGGGSVGFFALCVFVFWLVKLLSPELCN